MPNKLVFFSTVLTIAGWLSACVNPQQVDLVERDQRRLRADMGNLQGDVDGFRATLADTRANIQQMQRDLSAIKERIDETRVQVGRQIGQTSRDGDQRVKNLESRLAKLEEDAKAQAQLLKSREDELKQLRDAAQAAEQRPLVYDGFADIALGETELVRKDYETAWRSFEKKDYQAAAGRFRDFLKKNPKTRLAAAAQFWLGESYFALKEFEKAIVAYDEVRRFPQTDKVAAALLRQGIAFGELGEKLNARLVLQELVEKFPQSAEAPRAKQRLKALES
ncbi:MAG TPA: tol-pal system protein YbgF [Candidatus Limnocylindrales bacterium]|nr:tol-pal system protein YbgF [Candidatus Limnocylindrales bacterium]